MKKPRKFSLPACIISLVVFVAMLAMTCLYVYFEFAKHDKHIFDDFNADNATLMDRVIRNSQLLQEGDVGGERARLLCPLIPPRLRGRVEVRLDAPPLQVMAEHFRSVQRGHWQPDCISRTQKMAIIVPFRDRHEHLLAFLWNLHPILQRQQIDYTIFVVEQKDTKEFNRAKLFNVGFLEALRMDNFTCFIFHDVDLIPEDDRNLYTCPGDEPRHMSVAIDKFYYRLPYLEIFGGVSAIQTETFIKVNGFSNNFWGWGGEDDNLYYRLVAARKRIHRYPAIIARYKMLAHEAPRSKPLDMMRLVYGAGKTMHTDGLDSCNYEVARIEDRKMYMLIAAVI